MRYNNDNEDLSEIFCSGIERPSGEPSRKVKIITLLIIVIIFTLSFIL